MYESLSCPPEWIKIIQSLIKHAEDAGKQKNVQELEDYSAQDQLGLMNNYHKTEKQPWIIQETTNSIKIQGYANFRMSSFLINSV